MAGIIQSIQQVTITIAAGSASNTATITSVDTTKACIWNQEFTSADTGNEFGEIFAGVDLTNATTVTATRAISSGTAAVTVYCTVIEFVSSAITSIQKGTISLVNVASNTATISSVTTSRSVAILNGWTNSSTDNFPGREFCAVTLTNATTVTGIRGTNPANTAVVYYTIVEFASGITQSVQQFATSLSTTGTAPTQTISSVTTGNSLLVWGGFTVGGTSTVNATDILYTLQLTAATTVTLTRIGSNNSNTRIYYYTVLEFASGNINSLQRGTMTLASQTSNTTTITSVTTSRSFVNYCGHRHGLSSIPVGINFPSLALTDATTITARMNTSNATTQTQSYEVVEFAAADTTIGGFNQYYSRFIGGIGV